MMTLKTQLAHLNKKLTTALLFVILGLSTGCADFSQFSVQSLNDTDNIAFDDPAGASPDPSVPEEVPAGAYKMVPLAWENAKYPERKQWSAYLQRIVLNEWSSLLPGANDIAQFCPSYHNLSNEERANVWAQIFVAIARYESAYNPLSRMHETTMGNDPVTGKPVYSEGLLQLSYQDVQWARWCEFDWSKDKSLSPTSAQKTILNPYINLNCGVGIMARQVKNKGSIVLSSGVYWAVIKSGGKYQQLSSIQSMVRSFPLCK